MASLIGEAMLLGKWDNTTHLENSLNIPELQLIITAAREQEERANKFAAALKGINLDEGKGSVDKVEEMKRRIEAEQKGMSVEALDFTDLGFDVETD